jgi:Flp pilus assembly protein TadG
VSIVYISVAMLAMLGFCSFSVDLGRYEMCKTQLHMAADAAARAGVANLSGGTTVAKNAATNIATANTVDGSAIASSSVTVQFLSWTNASHYTVLSGASGANAVRVTISYNVPLLFAQALGLAQKNAVESGTAEITTTTDSEYIPATADVWLAGEPNNTRGGTTGADWTYDYAGPIGQNASDGNPYASPVQMNITASPGAVITVSNISGLASYDPQHQPQWGPDGDQNHIYDDYAADGTAEHGMSDATMGLCSLNAVFLSNSLPDNIQTPPPALDFSTTAEQNYSAIQPQLQQVFFVGNGQTSSNAQQQIVVPAGATRLFLGCMDGYEWYDNQGGFNVTVTQTNIFLVQ